MQNNHSIDVFRQQRVVLDTQGPMVYIGRLDHWDERGYWLSDADVHDRTDGHSTKEVYVNQAAELEKGGALNVNRRRVFVERLAVVSISALADVVSEAQPPADDGWTP